MRLSRAFSCLVATAIVFIVLWSVPLVQAQSAQKYSARLSAIPIASANARNNIDGIAGIPTAVNVTATLAGTKLTITGDFENLKTPATIAQVHQGLMMGMRGPVVFDLTVTKAPKGSISGTFDLKPDQVELLKAGRLYIQIHTEGTPDGALWGWLVK